MSIESRMTSYVPEQHKAGSARLDPKARAEEVAAAREALLASVAELRGQFAPGPLAARAGRSVAGWFTKPQGGIRPERVAIAGAVVLGLVAVAVVSRRRR